jgi:hypothetical protein
MIAYIKFLIILFYRVFLTNYYKPKYPFSDVELSDMQLRCKRIQKLGESHGISVHEAVDRLSAFRNTEG